MIKYQMPIKPSQILSSVFLAVFIVWLSFSASAQAPRNQDSSGLIYMPDSLSTDTLLIDPLEADTLFEMEPEELHPLQWDYVKQNHKIEHLLHLHRNAMADQRGIPGYRVHLYMDSGNRARLNTQHEQAAFEELYPEQRSYIVYEEPYFKLRAGDFRTRLDARRFLEKIRRNYPAAYIVVDRINYPEMD